MWPAPRSFRQAPLPQRLSESAERADRATMPTSSSTPAAALRSLALAAPPSAVLSRRCAPPRRATRAPPLTAKSSSSKPTNSWSPATPTPSATSTSAPSTDRRSAPTSPARSRSGRPAATMPTTAQFEGATDDGTRSSSRPKSGWSRPTPTAASTSTCATWKPGRRRWSPRATRPARPAAATAPSPPRFAGVDAERRPRSSSTPKSSSPAATPTTRSTSTCATWTAKTTKLVSAGDAACLPGCGNGAFDVSRRGISADGTYAYFTTAEQLSGADTDAAIDIYARDLETGTTTLVSAGSCRRLRQRRRGADLRRQPRPTAPGSSSAAKKSWSAPTATTATDVYARDLPAGPTILISGGSGRRHRQLRRRLRRRLPRLLHHRRGLVAADEDGANDVYEWTRRDARTWSPRPTCAQPLRGHLRRGQRRLDRGALQHRRAARPPQTTDDSDDIYRQQVGGGAPVLVSRGKRAAPPAGNGDFDARFDRSLRRRLARRLHHRRGAPRPKTTTTKTTSTRATSAPARSEPDHDRAELLPAEKRQLRRHLRRCLRGRPPRLLPHGRALHPRRRRQRSRRLRTLPRQRPGRRRDAAGLDRELARPRTRPAAADADRHQPRPRPAAIDHAAGPRRSRRPVRR